MPTWNHLFYIIVALILVLLIYLLAPMLTPFLVGTLLAYLVNPLVSYLMRWRLNRLTSVIIVFIFTFFIIISAILLLIPLLQEQINTLISLIPNVINWVQQTALPRVAAFLGSYDYINTTTLKTALAKQWTQAGTLVGVLLNTVIHSGLVIFTWIINLMIIPIVTFYLLLDWKQFIKGIRSLIPRHFEPSAVKIAKECDAVLSGFFRGQLLVMLAIAIYYSVGLSIIGLDIGIILGLAVGLISIVPYLGIIIGITTASITAFLQFGTFESVLLVWLLFIVGQLLDSLFVTPRLIGERIGLHPIAVIFAVLAGGSLFGFFGVLLALPATAVIMVWLRHLEHQYQSSQLYK